MTTYRGDCTSGRYAEKLAPSQHFRYSSLCHPHRTHPCSRSGMVADSSRSDMERVKPHVFQMKLQTNLLVPQTFDRVVLLPCHSMVHAVHAYRLAFAASIARNRLSLRVQD